MRWSVTTSATGSPLEESCLRISSASSPEPAATTVKSPCVAIAEIALDGADDLLVVVDREEHGFALGHGWTILVCVLC